MRGILSRVVAGAMVVWVAGCGASRMGPLRGVEPARTAHPSMPAGTKLSYLTPADVEALEHLLPPPAPDKGLILRGEGDLMLAMRGEATEGAIARAKGEESFRVWHFAEVLGPWFKKEALPKTADLMRKAELDSAVVSVWAKDEWGRQRPSLQDPRIKPLLGVPDSAAYPSGHATRAAMWAGLLAILAPDQAGALAQRGRLVGYDRVIGGVHYPSDVAAGWVLGSRIAEVMASSPAFRADLEAVRAEWAAARK